MDGWLKRLLTEDLGLKAVSLLLGVGIWYGVYQMTLGSEPLPEVAVEILAPQGTDWAIQVRPSVVRLKVSGPKHLVEKLQDRPVSVRIPLSENTVPDGAERRIPVEASHLFPRVRGITIESRPAEIIYSVDARVEMPFDVVADVADPPAGFTIDKILVNPRTVTVRGPKSFLGAAKAKGATLKTERLDPGYQGEGNFPFNGTRIIQSLEGLPVSCAPEALTVLVAVSHAREHRRIERIPLQRLVNPRDPHRTVEIPAEISIAVKGPRVVRLDGGRERLFHELSAEDVAAYVTIPAALAPGKHPDIPVTLRLPDGVALDQASPTVPVEIK